MIERERIIKIYSQIKMVFYSLKQREYFVAFYFLNAGKIFEGY